MNYIIFGGSGFIAGGFGTRISEESAYKPKPMIEIGGMPILWHIMKTYATYGFNEFVICAGYKQHVIKKRNYYIETNEDQYIHAHNKKDLDLCRQVITELYPDYLPKFNEVMGRTWQHKFNTFIMDRKHLDSYCTWLFNILFEIEKRTDLDVYDVYQGRVLGYLAERLLDVWLEHDQIEFQEVKLAMLEKQNWLIKGTNFLKRKFIKSARPFQS